jgi:hypothetical protein
MVLEEITVDRMRQPFAMSKAVRTTYMMVKIESQIRSNKHKAAYLHRT